MKELKIGRLKISVRRRTGKEKTDVLNSLIGFLDWKRQGKYTALIIAFSLAAYASFQVPDPYGMANRMVAFYSVVALEFAIFGLVLWLLPLLLERLFARHRVKKQETSQ